MKQITETAKSAILFTMGLAMAAAVAMFALFTIGGLVALGLLAIPVGLVASWMLNERASADDVINAEAHNVSIS